MQTDRNLLFGVLAFQDEYIDLAQLAAICRVWAADKSRSIPQLLVERQWVKDAECDELERKVDRKLKRFVGDVHATLGAVADGAVRDVLKQINDPDISAAIPELSDKSRLGFHPDRDESSLDRSGWNPNLQSAGPNSQQSNTSEPRYTRGQLQGEGSFGIVWLAHDKQLDREVALKELKKSRSQNPDLWRRFLREAQVTGKLQHPNIVPVYELDPRTGGEQPFYTMKPVQGRTLRKAIDAFHQDHKGRPSETLELNRLLQAFVQVCEALAYAHSRDVVHRDLKPENIVLGDFGEVIVLDWGEAKIIGKLEPPPDPAAETLIHDPNAPPVSSSGIYLTDDAADAPGTELGSMKGSPGYMSPEQVRGESDLIEARTDVYGLGAILFDILIGHPPHRLTPELSAKWKELMPNQKLDAWRSIILANPTPRVRQHDATIPVALDAICAKAMAAEQSARYSSANDLAQDIQRFLADEPVSVCQDPITIRARRWMKRHQVVVATTAATVLMAVVGLSVLAGITTKHNKDLTKANRKKDEQTKLAIQRGDDLDKANKVARRNLYVTDMNLAQLNWEKNNVRLVLDRLDRYRAESGTGPTADDLRGFEWYYWDRLCHSSLMKLNGHSRTVVFDPDGKRLASAGGYGETTVKIWDTAGGRNLLILKGHSEDVTSVAFSPDRKHLASASFDRTVKVWDATSGQEMLTLKGHMGWVRSVAFSPDGKRLASAGGGYDEQRYSLPAELKVWDVTDGHEMLSLTGHTAAVNSVAFSPDGNRLASASMDHTVKIWDAVSGQELLTVKRHNTQVLSIAFSPDGKSLASASDDQRVEVWDATSGRRIFTLKGHTSGVRSVAFSPDGQWLASASLDDTVKMWDAVNGHETLTVTLKGHTSGVEGITFSPDGKRLASVSIDGSVIVWDAVSGQAMLSLRGHSSAVNSVSFSPDGKQLASAGSDWRVKVWDSATTQETLTLEGHTQQFVNSVAFSADGKRLASASDDRTVKLWDAVSGSETFSLKGHTDAVCSVAFNPDGKRLASASHDKTVKLWDTMNGQETLTLKGHTNRVNSVAFSLDGMRLASGGGDGAEDNTVRLWDVTSGREMLTLKGHTGRSSA